MGARSFRSTRSVAYKFWQAAGMRGSLDDGMRALDNIDIRHLLFNIDFGQGTATPSALKDLYSDEDVERRKWHVKMYFELKLF